MNRAVVCRGDFGKSARNKVRAAFRKMKTPGFDKLISIGECRVYAENELLLRQGERSECFNIVARGRLKASRLTSGGRGLILGLYGPGDVVGFAGAFTGRRHKASVRAVLESQCLLVHRDRLMGLFSRRPRLVSDLLPPLIRNLVGCTNCLAESACQPVEKRIARLFLKLLADTAGALRGEGWIPLRLSRRELADLTGTTVESCCRVMSRLRHDRIVFTSDNGFVVRDPAALREIALG